MAQPPLLHQYLEIAQPYLSEYGYAALFVGVFLEGFGIPAPGQSLIIASALFAAQGRLNLALVLSLAWAAAVLGDNLGFAIGHFGGRRLVVRHGRYIGLRDHHLQRVEAFFDRYGGVVVAFARFFEVLRQLNGVVAGSIGMRWWHFLLYNAAGAALWVALWGYLVYRLGQHMNTALHLFVRFEPYIIAAGILGLVGLGLYLFKRNRGAR